MAWQAATFCFEVGEEGRVVFFDDFVEKRFFGTVPDAGSNRKHNFASQLAGLMNGALFLQPVRFGGG